VKQLEISTTSAHSPLPRLSRGVVDWFLPEGAQTLERGTLRRARLVVWISFGVVAFALPLMIRNAAVAGFPSLTTVAFLIGSAVMATNPFLLKRTGSHQIAGTAICLELIAFLGVMTYANGGLDSAALFWTAPIPLIAAFLVGFRTSLACAGLISGGIVTLYGLGEVGVDFPRPLSDPEMRWWLMAGLASMICFLTMLGWLFESERKRASLENFWVFIEQTPYGVAVLQDGTLVYKNEALNGVVGRSFGLLGRPLESFVHANERSAMREHLAQPTTGNKQPREFRWSSDDGSERIVEVTAVHRCEFNGEAATLILVRDLTEQRALQLELRQAEHLASMGTLSAGIAHEINNPLTYVMSNLGQLRDGLEQLSAGDGTDRAELDAMLEDAIDGAGRVATIVSDLKGMAVPDAHELRALDLRQELDMAIRIARHETRHRARVITDCRAVPMVDADGQLAQVFLNLIVNAAQSIPPGHVEENFIRVTTETGKDGLAVVEIEDTGEGIAPEVMAHLFDPFFTTRTHQGGTGLGLGIVQRILTSFGGTISVESEVGEGTRFRVVLPASQLAATAPVFSTVRPADPAGERETVESGGHRGLDESGQSGESGSVGVALSDGPSILLVDDETLITKSLMRILRQHDVTVAHSGREALERCRDSRFDVILLDLTMPDMTGREVYGRLRDEFPGLEEAVVLMTGGALTEVDQEFLTAIPNRVIYKPFEIDTVRSVIGQVSSP